MPRQFFFSLLVLLRVFALVCDAAADGESFLREVQVFALADNLRPEVCHLARSVQAAGGQLNVVGLSNASYDDLARYLKWGDPSLLPPEMIAFKKPFYYRRALTNLPPNQTILVLDGMDVLLQRPLSEIVASYRNIADPVVASSGAWPVLFGGERNCWPWAHNGHIRYGRRSLHHISAWANVTGFKGESFIFDGGGQNRATLRGDQICANWLAAQHLRPGASKTGTGRVPGYPFLNSGVYIGRVGEIRKMLTRVLKLVKKMKLVKKTKDLYSDQAFLSLLALWNQSRIVVDVNADFALSLHGFEERIDERTLGGDLQGDLCRGQYFKRVPGSPANQDGHVTNLANLRTPALAGKTTAPGILHFNGNGKLIFLRCVEEFFDVGVVGPPLSKRTDIPQIPFDMMSATSGKELRELYKKEQKRILNLPQECEFFDVDMGQLRYYTSA